MTDVKRLALAIATYNRSEILASNLSEMAEELKALDIPVYVSDDSDNDETEIALAALADHIPNLHYRRNQPALRHDGNLIATLGWPEADYVWLLGDSLKVRPGYLRRLRDFVDNQDMVFVSSHAQDPRMIRSIEGEGARALTRELLWHQTLTGATIYGRRVRNWIRADDSRVIVKRNFPQLSVILGFQSARSATIGWFGEDCLAILPKTSYWASRAISVFVNDWIGLVTAFPEVIAEKDRKWVIRSHSKKMRLFSLRRLAAVRLSGDLKWADLRRPRFFTAMHLNPAMVIGLMLVPLPALRLAERAYGSLKRSSRS